MINECKINITAHAGCMNTNMDSIESVKAGIKHGADIIEIDLNIDKENNLVLSHGVPQEGVEYPEFKIVLEKIKNQKNVLINMDIKNTTMLGWLKNVILESKILDRIFLTGLTYNDIISNKEFLHGLNYFINLEISDIKNCELEKLIDILETLDVLGINIDYRLVTPELIFACKERKLFTSVWTVDDVYEMEKLIKLKVNCITTNKIDVLKNKISEYNIKLEARCGDSGKDS